MLQRHQYAVDIVPSAEEALTRLHSGVYDTVIVDHVLPMLDGLETVTQIRASWPDKSLPVVMALSGGTMSEMVDALSDGATDFVDTSTDLSIALNRIDSQVARRSSSEAVGRAERRLALAVEGSNDGIWEWDLQDDCLTLSSRWYGLLGLRANPDSVGPDLWLDRIHTEDRHLFMKALRASLDGTSEYFSSEHRIRHENGTYRWALARGVVARSALGEPERVGGSLTDITDRKAVDHLTGLPNRAPLSARIDRTLARLRQHPEHAAALFVLNVDGVGTINEGYGEHFGDMVLQTVADRLTNKLRPTDVVASLGGDEFSVFLDKIDDPSNALRIAKRIQDVVAETIKGDDRSINLTAGVGVVISAPHHERGNDMITEAFTALNRAKKSGKGGIALFDEEMQSTAARRLDTEHELRVAIEHGAIQLAYQPIIDLENGGILGFEGLARWHHEERGLISPGEFIPVAEESGLIIPMTWRLLDVAAETASVWMKDYAKGRPFFISVNLSARNFETPTLVRDTADILREHNVPPEYLKVEVTESKMMNDIEGARRTLEEFREAGIRIALDDFGTGHSSLAYLAKLPLDTLKIDRSFIDQSDIQVDKQKILQAIVSLGNAFDMLIVGEGIETSGEHDVVRTLGCTAGQGFLYARPTAAEDLVSLLENWSVDLDKLAE